MGEPATTTNTPEQHAAHFFIDARPKVVWRHDLRRTNREFLAEFGLVDQVRYLIEIHSSGRTYNANQAVAALRVSYGLALETLMALIASAVQAPDCVFGWLELYKNYELENVISALRTPGATIRSKINLQAFTWQDFALHIHRNHEFSELPEEDAVMKAQFGRAWARLADEFLDDDMMDEYNAAKHGWRLQSGPMTVSVGRKPKPGDELGLREIDSVEHGYEWIALRPIDATSMDYRVADVSRRWNPDAIEAGLKWIAVSAANIVAALQLDAGEKISNAVFQYPGDDSVGRISTPSLSLEDQLNLKDIGGATTPSEVEAVCGLLEVKREPLRL